MRDPSHEALIQDQFSRQAELFAKSSELHNDAQIALLIGAADPKAGDTSLDVACGPGTVVAAFAPHVTHAVGLDATDAMLDQARALSAEKFLANVDWRRGDVYALPFETASFDIVSCRYAFHHLQSPERAFAEMLRVCKSGGRIVLCDGVASDDPQKAAAFNAMERHRDPSTAAFKTLGFLQRLFACAGLPAPRMTPFTVVYDTEAMIAKSFPANDDRATLRQMIQELIDTDALDVGTQPGGPQFHYAAVVLAATKP